MASASVWVASVNTFWCLIMLQNGHTWLLVISWQFIEAFYIFGTSSLSACWTWSKAKEVTSWMVICNILLAGCCLRESRWNFMIAWDESHERERRGDFYCTIVWKKTEEKLKRASFGQLLVNTGKHLLKMFPWSNSLERLWMSLRLTVQQVTSGFTCRVFNADLPCGIWQWIDFRLYWRKESGMPNGSAT